MKNILEACIQVADNVGPLLDLCKTTWSTNETNHAISDSFAENHVLVVLSSGLLGRPHWIHRCIFCVILCTVSHENSVSMWYLRGYTNWNTMVPIIKRHNLPLDNGCSPLAPRQSKNGIFLIAVINWLMGSPPKNSNYSGKILFK